MPRGLLQLLKSNEVGSHSCNRVSHVEQTVDDRVREVTVNNVASRSLSSRPRPVLCRRAKRSMRAHLDCVVAGVGSDHGVVTVQLHSCSTQ